MTKLEYVNDREVPLFLLQLFFCIAFSMIIFTLPCQVVIYMKIIRSKEYRRRFVYKLIVFNGIVNILLFFFYIPAVHIGIFPSLRSLIISFNDNHLPPVFLFLFMTTVAAQSHSTLAISINRLATLTCPNRLHIHDHFLYIFSLISSNVFPIIISFPILFTNYQFVERRMNSSGLSVFRTEVGTNEMYILPSAIYCVLLNAAAFVFNIILFFLLWRLNRRGNESTPNQRDTTRVENGLVLSIAINGLLHGLIYGFAFMTASLEWIHAGATLILLIALSSILPFWLLILLVPSLRKELSRLFIYFKPAIFASTTSNSAI